MRILIANPQLAQRAGSELVTGELAEVLLAKGHDVAVFTVEAGPFADTIPSSLPRVLTFGDEQLIRDFSAEVIHAHDWPSLTVLQQVGVRAPAVMAALGPMPPVHNPPPLESGQALRWWAVSEETRANVAAIRGWADSANSVIPTWFDDRHTPRVRPWSAQLERLLVVSNHFPPTLDEELRVAAAARGISVERVGLPGPQRTIDSDLLLSFDAVVTLGRTVVHAMALGRPALVADMNGADGWVTPANLDSLAGCNFSGRARRLVASAQQIGAWLDGPPTPNDLEVLRGRAWSERRLTTCADQVEGQLLAAVAEPVTWAFGRWSTVVADLMRRTREDEIELLARAEALRGADDRELAARSVNRHLINEVEQLRGERVRLAAEYESLGRTVATPTRRKWCKRFGGPPK